MLPVEHTDPINAKILAISEDKIEGFVREPFQEIAQRSAIEPDVVMARIAAMLKAGTIRRVRQTLLATNLADGALVAWKVAPEKIDPAFDWMFQHDPFSGHVVLRSTDAVTLLPSTLPDIEFGRGEIEKQITESTRQKIADFGIELLDLRFKRSKYSPAVADKIIERMSSERHQIASKFRSEGKGEAANISGQKESDVAAISSGATKIALEIEGKADAEASAIYAAAFNSPDAQELFSFVRSLDVMRAAFQNDTTAVISTNSDLGRMLKSMAPTVAPARP